ncbi:MAG: hypothetical protein D4R67_08885 [Bacteroidetes bacterium]|nr:MAG: hypothetical protein D4R67_08885 [Bacteroidota bacterium]
MNPKWLVPVLSDIRFWILLFFAVRLFGITDPPIETTHSWRQAFTCMVSRNMVEISANPMYPRTDMPGYNPDIVASEFPAFNFIIFLVARAFGYSHWYGRLINLLISSLGIYCFYLMVRRYYGERTAFFAGVILLFSVWFTFSRKIMPDTFSISMVLIGLWFLTRYLDRNRPEYLLFFFLTGTLGGLSKIPATVILATALIPLFVSRIRIGQRVLTGTALFLSVAVISAWYFWWEPYLLRTYHNQLYFPRSVFQGFQELIDMGFWTVDKFTFVALQSYVGLASFILGFYYAIRNRNKLILVILVLTGGMFFIYMVKAGNVFSNHTYYIIPFVPVMALLAGYGLASLPRPGFSFLLLAGIAVEAILNQYHDFLIKESDQYKVNLESIADQVSEREDLVAVNGGLDPQLIYFLHRKGWSVSDEDLRQPGAVDQMQQAGCKYLFIIRSSFQDTLPYSLVYQQGNVQVYRLARH